MFNIVFFHSVSAQQFDADSAEFLLKELDRSKTIPIQEKEHKKQCGSQKYNDCLVSGLNEALEMAKSQAVEQFMNDLTREIIEKSGLTAEQIRNEIKADITGKIDYSAQSNDANKSVTIKIIRASVEIKASSGLKDKLRKIVSDALKQRVSEKVSEADKPEKTVSDVKIEKPEVSEKIEKAEKPKASVKHAVSDVKVVKPKESEKYAVSDVKVEKPKPSEKIIKWKHAESGMEMEFIKVLGGKYEMGCGSWADKCNTDEKLHTEEIKAFWIGKTEVTIKQWRMVMGNSKEDNNIPIDNVSWHDIQKFIEKISSNNKAYVFRLPTEAEWEYACRSGGKPENYSGGNDPDEFAWYQNTNKDRKIRPVGQKAPNGLGIYDMSGNVREWTQDNYEADYSKRQTDSSGTKKTKVVRGGGWLNGAQQIRCTHREQYFPDSKKSGLGFRLIMIK